MIQTAKPHSVTAPEEKVLTLWQRYGGSALGRSFFNFLLGRLIPYTGSVRPRIQEIAPGHALVVIKDHRGIRNHLRSIHAIALANAGELASGLALVAALPKGIRGIVTGLEIEYAKKARGMLTAVGEAQVPAEILDPVKLQAKAIIKDSGDDIVATLTAHWLLSPKAES